MNIIKTTTVMSSLKYREPVTLPRWSSGLFQGLIYLGMLKHLPDGSQEFSMTFRQLIVDMTLPELNHHSS